jgi:hypothetical protein
MHGTREALTGEPSGMLAGDRQTAQSESEHTEGTASSEASVVRSMSVYKADGVLSGSCASLTWKVRIAPSRSTVTSIVHANVLAAIEWNVRN